MAAPNVSRYWSCLVVVGSAVYNFLFDLMLYDNGKQLRSCRDGQLLNHTVPVQVEGSLSVLSAHYFPSN